MYWRCVYVAVRSAVLACVLCGAAEMAGDAVGRTGRMAQCRSEAGLELGNSENVVARPGFREPPSACGSFYQLENTGTGPMILMGHRSGNQDNVMIIDYVTRKDIRQDVKVRNRHTGAERPAGT